MTRRWLTLCLLLPLVACDPATATMVIVGSSAASLAHTDKTMPDHVATWVTGEDCSLLRYTEENGPYCQPEAQVETPATAPQLVCYRTLGTIDCYDKPDPKASSFTMIR